VNATITVPPGWGRVFGGQALPAEIRQTPPPGQTGKECRQSFKASAFLNIASSHRRPVRARADIPPSTAHALAVLTKARRARTQRNTTNRWRFPPPCPSGPTGNFSRRRGFQAPRPSDLGRSSPWCSRMFLFVGESWCAPGRFGTMALTRMPVLARGSFASADGQGSAPAALLTPVADGTEFAGVQGRAAGGR